MRKSFGSLAPLVLLLGHGAGHAASGVPAFRAHVLTAGTILTTQPTQREALKLLIRSRAGAFEAIARCSVDDEGRLSACSVGPNASRETKAVQRVAQRLAERMRVDAGTRRRLEGRPIKLVSILMRADDGRTAICPREPCQSLFGGIPTPPPPPPPPPLPLLPRTVGDTPLPDEGRR